ncbi:outer envelope pore protein 21, chloroplastic-like protein [Tanacetum coccineum]
MNTSIRYGGGGDGESSSRFEIGNVRINAKQKLQFINHTSNYPLLLQLNGELDTGTGAPTFLCALVRHFYPNMSASLGAGLHYDRNEKLHCTLRAKKAFPVASSNSKFKSLVILSLVLSFLQKPDSRIRLFEFSNQCHVVILHSSAIKVDILVRAMGMPSIRAWLSSRYKLISCFLYHTIRQIPYVQLRENNWTFNADITGRWNVRYNL